MDGIRCFEVFPCTFFLVCFCCFFFAVEFKTFRCILCFISFKKIKNQITSRLSSLKILNAWISKLIYDFNNFLSNEHPGLKSRQNGTGQETQSASSRHPHSESLGGCRRIEEASRWNSMAGSGPLAHPGQWDQSPVLPRFLQNWVLSKTTSVIPPPIACFVTLFSKLFLLRTDSALNFWLLLVNLRRASWINRPCPASGPC